MMYLLPENNALMAFCWLQELEIVTALMTIRKEKTDRGPYLQNLKDASGLVSRTSVYYLLHCNVQGGVVFVTACFQAFLTHNNFAVVCKAILFHTFQRGKTTFHVILRKRICGSPRVCNRDLTLLTWFAHL